MLNREEKIRKQAKIEEIAMQWQKLARVEFLECKELLALGLKGYVGEVYRNRFEKVCEAMEETANALWKGIGL